MMADAVGLFDVMNVGRDGSMNAVPVAGFDAAGKATEFMQKMKTVPFCLVWLLLVLDYAASSMPSCSCCSMMLTFTASCSRFVNGRLSVTPTT